MTLAGRATLAITRKEYALRWSELRSLPNEAYFSPVDTACRYIVDVLKWTDPLLGQNKTEIEFDGVLKPWDGQYDGASLDGSVINYHTQIKRDICTYVRNNYLYCVPMYDT